MGIIEWNCVPISSNDVHVFVYTECSMAISSAGFFADNFGFFVIEDYFWELELWVFRLYELVLLA